MGLELAGKRLMCVVAHPDDECYAFGGALALAAAQGAETYVVCLTDGQAATNRGSSSSSEDLGRIRKAEFAASCAILNVTRHELLDYQDAQLEFVDFSQAAGRLVSRIRSFKPDVVITFGLDGGMNTHPDHTVVSALTSAAYHWAANPKRFPDHDSIHTAIHKTPRLYHVTTTFFLAEFGQNRPSPLPAPWSVTLDVSTVFPSKVEAFRAHTSQAPLMERTQPIFEKHGNKEVYTLMATLTPQAACLSASLFDGL